MGHLSMMPSRVSVAWSSAILILCGVGLPAWAAPSAAKNQPMPPQTLIIADTFHGPKMDAIRGRTPDQADAPGGRWTAFRIGQSHAVCRIGSLGLHAPSKAVLAAYPKFQGNIPAKFNGQAVIAIPIANHGSYKKPQRFTISADLGGYFEVNIALGFYSHLPVTVNSALARATTTVNSDLHVRHTKSLFKNFTGLIFTTWSYTRQVPLSRARGALILGNPNMNLYRQQPVGRANGALTLYENGKPGISVPFTGNFDARRPHRLSYEVDTATGAISNVQLSGSTSDYSVFKSKAFTDAATAYAAVGNACSLLVPEEAPPHVPTWVVVNNFEVGVNLRPALPTLPRK